MPLIGAVTSPITSSGLVITSYVVGALLLIGALAVVLLRNVVYATAALAGTFLFAGVLYLVLDGGLLLFLVQVVIYGLGVAALLYFLLRLIGALGKGNTNAFNRQWIAPAIVALAVLLLLLRVLILTSWPRSPAPNVVEGLGTTLINTYPVALATLVVVVLAALLGAGLLLTRRVPERAVTVQPVGPRGKRRRGRPDSRP